MALHFPVPMSTEGVERLDTWRAHGMRGTGSHDIMLRDVFVPEEKVAVRRPAGVWHPSFDVVVTVALPIIMNVYLGIAEAAADLAIRRCIKRGQDRNVQQLIGTMGNELEVARMATESMTGLAENGLAEIGLDRTNAIAQRKTIARARRSEPWSSPSKRSEAQPSTAAARSSAGCATSEPPISIPCRSCVSTSSVAARPSGSTPSPGRRCHGRAPADGARRSPLSTDKGASSCPPPR